MIGISDPASRLIRMGPPEQYKRLDHHVRPDVAEQAPLAAEVGDGLELVAGGAAIQLVRHFGVSQRGTYYAPGTAADTGLAGVAGKVVGVHQEGEIALLKLGGTVNAGDLLTSDASGQGVAVTASTALQYIGAIALHDGSSGEFINVKVKCFEAVTA